MYVHTIVITQQISYFTSSCKRETGPRGGPRIYTYTLHMYDPKAFWIHANGKVLNEDLLEALFPSFIDLFHKDFSSAFLYRGRPLAHL